MRKRRRKELALPGLWEDLQTQALRMRREPTLAERRLWEEIRAGKIGGCRFRRQHPIGRFIVDFYCVSAGLVLEVDGKIHAAQIERDQVRTAVLQGMGLRVLRFTNNEVLQQTDDVLQRIREALNGTSLD